MSNLVQLFETYTEKKAILQISHSSNSSKEQFENRLTLSIKRIIGITSKNLSSKFSGL